MPGGLGYVAIAASVLLASMSGSAIADTAALATLLLPMMRRQNYPDGSSAGLIASGGIDQAMARDLAAKIIDYERCMEHQRANNAQCREYPRNVEGARALDASCRAVRPPASGATVGRSHSNAVARWPSRASRGTR